MQAWVYGIIALSVITVILPIAFMPENISGENGD